MSGKWREKIFPAQHDTARKCSDTDEWEVQVFLEKGVWGDTARV